MLIFLLITVIFIGPVAIYYVCRECYEIQHGDHNEAPALELRDLEYVAAAYATARL